MFENEIKTSRQLHFAIIFTLLVSPFVNFVAVVNSWKCACRNNHVVGQDHSHFVTV